VLTKQQAIQNYYKSSDSSERPCAVKWSSGTVTRLATGSAAVLSQGDCIELLYQVGDGMHGAVGSTKYEVH
jgi:hypothetical protein